MQSKDGTKWYSKKEVFEVVHARRLALDEAQFEDWQKKGIVPLGRRIGRGRKKGVAVGWSQEQVGLICKVCELRQHQGVREVAALCNAPIWAWLYLGEASGVDLAQVRRVMRTWGERHTSMSIKEVKERVRELVELVGNNPRSHDRRHARRDLTHVLSTLKEGEVGQEFEDAFWGVYTEKRSANGPVDIALTPQLMRWYEESRRLGLEVVVQKNTLPDQRWWWARHIQLQTVAEYLEQQPQYKQETAGTVVADLFSLDIVGTLVASACEDVVLALGMQERLLASKKQRMREAFDVERWTERVKNVRVETEQVRSPLVLLNGAQRGGLRIREIMIF